MIPRPLLSCFNRRGITASRVFCPPQLTPLLPLIRARNISSSPSTMSEITHPTIKGTYASCYFRCCTWHLVRWLPNWLIDRLIDCATDLLTLQTQMAGSARPLRCGLARPWLSRSRRSFTTRSHSTKTCLFSRVPITALSWFWTMSSNALSAMNSRMAKSFHPRSLRLS